MKPKPSSTARRIVDDEQRRSQFLGDPTALDRLAQLSYDLLAIRSACAYTQLIAARIASMRHRFSEARAHLVTGEALGAPQAEAELLRLDLHQAVGVNLAAVLAARRATANATGALQHRVALGVLLTDLGEFESADRTHVRGIGQYRNVSPFALAWVCFQLGMLWGETVPTPDPDRARSWYHRALEYLPAYTNARVHLAELDLETGALESAESLLRPVVESGEPEVRWRLAQVLAAQGRAAEAAVECAAARAAFEALLARHELAFADHATEFYMSSGADLERACTLAHRNLANRPTLRAFELTHKAARASGGDRLAFDLALRAQAQWGDIKAFAYSPMTDAFGQIGSDIGGDKL